MKAADVMTPDVVVVDERASVLQAVQLMLQRKISGLPVVDNTCHLVGIVTEGDFLRRVETGTQRHRPRWIELLVGPGRLASEYVHTSGRKVREVMTTDVLTVTEETPLEAVVEVMERRRVKRLPVLRSDQIVGIISRANLLRALASAAHDIPAPSADDMAIRARLLAEIRAQPWGPGRMIDVAVKDRVVKLSGVVLDDRQRQALRVAAENIPGVKKVEDHLVWIEPVSGMVVEPVED